MKTIFALTFTAFGVFLTLFAQALIHHLDAESTAPPVKPVAQVETSPPTPVVPPVDPVAQRHKKIGFTVPTKEELDKQGLAVQTGVHPHGKVVVTGYAASLPMSLAIVFHASDPLEVALRNPFHCENRSFGDAMMMTCPGIVYLESQEAEITGQFNGTLLQISTELNFENGPFRLALFVRVNDAKCISPGTCEIKPVIVREESMLTTELNRKE